MNLEGSSNDPKYLPSWELTYSLTRLPQVGYVIVPWRVRGCQLPDTRIAKVFAEFQQRPGKENSRKKSSQF